MTGETRESRRILVVEDETMIAMMIEDALQHAGYTVVGPTSKLATALQLVEDEKPDAAILDVSIRGGKIYPLTERLHARGIPYVLASGYSDSFLPEELRGRPRLSKPFSEVELQTQVKNLCERIDAA